jgi:protein involved in temperature-dependent protein secretion
MSNTNDELLEKFFASRQITDKVPDKLQDAINQLFPLHDVMPNKNTDGKIRAFLMGAYWVATLWAKAQAQGRAPCACRSAEKFSSE